MRIGWCQSSSGSGFYAGDIRSPSQFDKGTALKIIRVVLNEFPSIARRSQKRRAWFETPRDRHPFSERWSAADIPGIGSMGTIHHVSHQVSLVSPVPRVENDDRLVTEDEWVVSDWNKVPASKSGRSVFDVFSSMVSLRRIKFRLGVEGGSGYN